MTHVFIIGAAVLIVAFSPLAVSFVNRLLVEAIS